LTAGNSPQFVAEQILEACNPILRAVAPSYILGKGDGLPILVPGIILSGF